MLMLISPQMTQLIQERCNQLVYEADQARLYQLASSDQATAVDRLRDWLGDRLIESGAQLKNGRLMSRPAHQSS